MLKRLRVNCLVLPNALDGRETSTALNDVSSFLNVNAPLTPGAALRLPIDIYMYMCKEICVFFFLKNIYIKEKIK